tara:strand:+ start:4023 stop:4286 length:264 start_codon:yes stop_codon:yes gene_type:complete
VRKTKKNNVTENRKQWNRLFDYEIVYHLDSDIIPQSKYFKSESPEQAFNCFQNSMKNRLNSLFVDEFAKHNPYSNQKELLDIPKNIL